MTRTSCAIALAVIAFSTGAAHAGPDQDAIVMRYEQAARTTDAGFGGFSAERGKAFFLDKHTGGKAETPTCTTCHGKSPRKSGRTRAGKEIKPMALSKSPKRFSDWKKVEKWFRRNCKNVLGRECTAAEKGDFLAFMTSQ